VELQIPVNAPTRKAGLAVIALHGRGQPVAALRGSISVIEALDVQIVFPEASGGQWYPRSFLAPLSENEPALTQALATVTRTFESLLRSGYDRRQVILLGFSQGAALAAEFVGRLAGGRIGGLIAWTGGRLGPPGCTWAESDRMDSMPVLVTGSDDDPFVPWCRCRSTAEHFSRRGASTLCRIENRPHAIDGADLALAKELIAKVAASRLGSENATVETGGRR